MTLFQKKLWRITFHLFWAVLWTFALSIVLLYSMRWILGDRFLPVRLLNYFMPWLLIGLIPGLIVAYLARRRRLLIALSVPTVFVVFTYAPLFLPRLGSAPSAGLPIKVMSYNVMNRNQNVATMAEVIKRERPDILMLQEIQPQETQTLLYMLRNLYPGSTPNLLYAAGLGQAIISRYTLNTVSVSTVKRNWRFQKVSIDTPNGIISVWNVHPHAPLMGFVRHIKEISLLIDDLIKAKGPLIMGGDFNTNEQSQHYQGISQYLNNAHWEAGWGFGFTYPTRARRLGMIAPLVRIDHIFYSDHFYAHSARTLTTSGGSDHLPVIAELSLYSSK